MSFLLNTICVILLLLTPFSYIPLSKNTAALKGLSVNAVLLLALAAQAQLVTMYFLWRCPPYKRDGNIIPKPSRFIDYINLSQIIVHWICHMSLSYIIPSTPEENKTAKTVLASHATLTILIIAITPAPREDWLDLPFVTLMSLNQYFINPLITILTITAIYLQLNTTRSSTNTGLEANSVAYLAAVYTLLAISWGWRFKVPRNRWPCRYSWVLEEWYPLVGWAGVNSTVTALGWIAVFCCIRGRSASEQREREALLRN